jgi:hypothetical protein
MRNFATVRMPEAVKQQPWTKVTFRAVRTRGQVCREGLSAVAGIDSRGYERDAGQSARAACPCCGSRAYLRRGPSMVFELHADRFFIYLRRGQIAWRGEGKCNLIDGRCELSDVHRVTLISMLNGRPDVIPHDRQGAWLHGIWAKSSTEPL